MLLNENLKNIILKTMKKDKLKKYLVQQSNALIESSQKMTLVERRIIYHTLSRINPKQPQQEYVLKVEDFANDFPQMCKAVIYEQLKEAVQKLFKRDIQQITDRGTTKTFYLLQEQEYKDGEGFLRMKFSDSTMPLIFELKEKFTTMILENFKFLDSTYSLRLYELLCQYQNQGWRQISVTDLRFFLGCEDTYPEFKRFKQMVIEPAIKEISEKSNLIVIAEYIRTSRFITDIKFNFYDKQDSSSIINVNVNEKNIKRPSLKRHPNPNNYDFNNENTKIQYQLDCFEWALENYKRLTTYENALKAQNKQLSSKDLELKKRYTSDIANTYNEFQSNRWDLELLNNLKGNVIDETLEKASQKAKSDKQKIDSIIDQRNKQIELEDLVI